jgi:transcriptional regulator with XRE-family HTH domain
MAKSSKILQKIELSVEQLNAIELLITGASDQAVADQVGVSRQTITDWRNNNDEFAAQLERKRQALWVSHEDDLRSLITKAVEILRDAMQSKDERVRIGAAVHVLRAVGLYSSSLKPMGDTSATMIALSKSLTSMF